MVYLCVPKLIIVERNIMTTNVLKKQKTSSNSYSIYNINHNHIGRIFLFIL